MPNKFILAWRDFDNDRQEVAYPVAPATVVGDFTSFAVEIEKWNTGAGAGGGFYDEQSVDNKVASTNPISQSSLQGIIQVKDTVNGNIHSYRLPFVDLAKADDVGTNPAFTVSADGFTVFNPDHADYATLEAEIETHMLSRDGNPVTLVRVYLEE